VNKVNTYTKAMVGNWEKLPKEAPVLKRGKAQKDSQVRPSKNSPITPQEKIPKQEQKTRNALLRDRRSVRIIKKTDSKTGECKTGEG